MIKNILKNKDKKTTGSTNPAGPQMARKNYYKLFNHYNQKYKLEELRAL